MKTIIHDLDNNGLKKLRFDKNDKIMSALECDKHCIGCFSCWIKTPTKCILKDDFSNNAKYLKNSDELIIISECRYGCYSAPVKRVLERCIGYVLPYFTIRNNEIHHQSRYSNKLKIKAYFYGDIKNDDEEILKQLVKANSINLEASDYEVICVKSIKELTKCIH